jgi:hypothetical protein
MCVNLPTFCTLRYTKPTLSQEKGREEAEVDQNMVMVSPIQMIMTLQSMKDTQ